jgi:hypothetical protein
VAGEAGFDARPLWVADKKRIAETIVESADELDVDRSVMGARRLTGVAALLGSVSNHVLQHAHRPVLIVPTTNAHHVGRGRQTRGHYHRATFLRTTEIQLAGSAEEIER